MLVGAHPGRTSDDELTVFKSLGIAVEDLAAAELVVANARERGHRHRGRVLIPLAEIERARETIRGAAIRTPLIRLHVDAPAEIWLKLENLQPIGSFKIRGAVNAIRQAPARATADGVVTASAGNMAQGVAWAARELGVPATIVVPEHAPQTKLDAIARLGGEVVKVPYERWWQAIVDVALRRGRRASSSIPCRTSGVMAGNGTIGLELAEELPDADAVLVPWGGGGLFTGIASALAARCARTRGSTPCSPRPARPCSRGARGRRAARDVATAPRSSTAPAPRRAARDVGARASRCSPAASSSRSTRRPPPFGCSPSARASSPRAPARSRSPPRSPATVPGRQARLHRLGRQHRRRAARDDPARRDA